MSLDAAELVMEAEESFGVALPAGDLERVNDLGDFYRLILKARGRARGGPCLSGHTFYRIRRALMESVGIPRREITPRSRLEDLLPVPGRRAKWEQLRENLDWLPLSNLRRPDWIIAGIAAVTLAFLGAGAAVLHGRPGVALWGGLIVAALWARLLLGTAMLTRATLRLTAPLAVCFPRNYDTVRDVVLDLLTHHYSLIASEANPSGPVEPAGDACEVWESLCRLITEHTGVDREKLTETTRLRDLGF